MSRRRYYVQATIVNALKNYDDAVICSIQCFFSDSLRNEHSADDVIKFNCYYY